MPNVPKAKIKSRIILTPQNAKRLLNALSDNLQKFELENGKIKDNILIKLNEIDQELREKININHDINISEFLGFQKPVGVIAHVEEETQLYFKETVLLGESLKNLNSRVEIGYYRRRKEP